MSAELLELYHVARPLTVFEAAAIAAMQALMASGEHPPAEIAADALDYAHALCEALEEQR